MEEIKVEKSLSLLLQEARYELSQMNLKKNGHNNFQGFDYYEEDDIMPAITKVCLDKGIFTLFEIHTDPIDGREYAYLTAIKGLEQICQKLPTAEPSGNNPIQQAGGKFTYMSRYSYMKFFNITEPDTVDASDNSKAEKAVETKCTKEQIDIIAKLYDPTNITKILEYYKIENLSDLTLKQASSVIAKKKKNG